MRSKWKSYPMVGLQINVSDKAFGIVEWCKNTTDGKKAMDIYNHPYFYGYGFGEVMPTNYEVWLRDKRTGNRRSIILWAESFSDAEVKLWMVVSTRKWFDLVTKKSIRIDKDMTLHQPMVS